MIPALLNSTAIVRVLSHGKQYKVHATPDPAAAGAPIPTAPASAPASAPTPAPVNTTASAAPLAAPERPQEALPTAVEDRLSELYQHASTSFVDPASNIEHSFIYNNGGNPGLITSSHEVNKNAVTVYPNTAGIIHSHPMQSLATPSSADIEVAKRAKVPNYVLSRNALWVATPDGKTRHIADVEWKDGKMKLNYVSKNSGAPGLARGLSH